MLFRSRLAPVALLALGITAIAWSTASAQAPAANRKVDEEAIRKAEAKYIEAAKQNDTKAMSAAWTAEGDYINAAGVRTKARDLIGQAVPSPDAASLLNDVKIKSSTLRLVTPEVAIEDGVTDTGADGFAGDAVRFTAVWVKQNGRWLLDSLRESPAPAIDLAAPAEVRNDLSELAFLAGDWTGSLGVSTYEFSAKFSEDKTVLVREFEVRNGERLTTDGTQYITLDRETGEISSKSVDSAGTRASCVWTRDADGTWHGDSVAETSDGRQLESSNYYIPNPDGTWTWSVVDAKVEGQSIPDSTIRFKRRPTP